MKDSGYIHLAQTVSLYTPTLKIVKNSCSAPKTICLNQQISIRSLNAVNAVEFHVLDPLEGQLLLSVEG